MRRPASEAGKGYFIKPAVFVNVTNSMRIAREEIFGPVLCVITYKTVNEAVDIANDTPYGLNAAVFGERELALSVAKHIKAGNVYVNGGSARCNCSLRRLQTKRHRTRRRSLWLMEFTQLKATFDR